MIFSPRPSPGFRAPQHLLALVADRDDELAVAGAKAVPRLPVRRRLVTPLTRDISPIARMVTLIGGLIALVTRLVSALGGSSRWSPA